MLAVEGSDACMFTDMQGATSGRLINYCACCLCTLAGATLQSWVNDGTEMIFVRCVFGHVIILAHRLYRMWCIDIVRTTPITLLIIAGWSTHVYIIRLYLLLLQQRRCV